MTDAAPTRRDVILLAAAGLLAAALPTSRASAATPIKVGTMGAGRLGGAVGGLFAKAGHDVMFSSRHPEELEDLVATLGPKASSGTIPEAIAFGDVVLLAVPYQAYPDVGRDFAASLKGKIVIDAGNANRSDLFEEAKANGIGVTTQKFFPGARIVRAFNAASAQVFVDNAGKSPKMAIPIAGDDAAAVDAVKTLVTSTGFEPLVVGGLKDADRFAMGTAGFGHVLPADALAEKLGVRR